MFFKAATCSFLLATGLAVGCGGSDDDPEDVVRTYLEAVADGDGEKACDQLTGEAKRQAVDFLSSQAPEFGATSCEDGLDQLSENLGEDEKDILREPGEATVEIDGDSATVTFEEATTPAELTKSGDDWLISGGLFE
jgi:hypothetical protein